MATEPRVTRAETEKIIAESPFNDLPAHKLRRVAESYLSALDDIAQGLRAVEAAKLQMEKDGKLIEQLGEALTHIANYAPKFSIGQEALAAYDAFKGDQQPATPNESETE